MMRECQLLHQNLGDFGKSIPSALEISLDPRDFPREINLSGVVDGFPNTSLVLVEHGYNTLRIQEHIIVRKALGKFLDPRGMYCRQCTDTIHKLQLQKKCLNEFRQRAGARGV